MLFNSYIFIFLFFPLCLAGLYLLERAGRGKAAKLWLVGFSLWFYGYFNPYYLAIMAGSILFNYLIARLLLQSRQSCGRRQETQSMRHVPEGHADASAGHMTGQKDLNAGRGCRLVAFLAHSRTILTLGICTNLAVLFYFKYYDFFVGNINALFGTDFLLKHLLLPLGISFFTFQQIGFLVDVYRRETAADSFVDYALFVSFFPQLIAGPIVNGKEMLPQFAGIGRRRFSPALFTGGLYLFVLGMAKKVLLADTFGIAVDYGYRNVASLGSVDAVLVMVFYTLQLYFDFSGYCDMARGLGHMMGIEIPVNFRSPYRARNPVEFWKRWHITLNRFLLQYVYIPLGGNRKGEIRMYGNLFLVFCISGVWHGAGWNFVVWGMLHGAVYVLVRMWQRRPNPRPFPGALSRFCGVACTWLFVNIAWVFFRAQDVQQALSLFWQMATGGIALPAAGIYEAFRLDEFWYIMKVLHLADLPFSGMYLCAVFLAVALWLVFFHKNAGEMAEGFTPKTGNMVMTAVLFLWCVLSLSGVSTFLYFNF